MDLELTILGTSAAMPGAGRSPSSQILQLNSRAYLIDCGEGTQFKLLRMGLLNQRIRQIFISHIHGDHHFGLAGLLSSSKLMGRKEPIEIFGPSGLEHIVRTQLGSMSEKLPFGLRFHTLSDAHFHPIFSDHQFSVWALPLRHRVPATGFLFREHPRQRQINIEAVQQYGVPMSKLPALKLGLDYQDPDTGNIVSNQLLTFDSAPSRSYAYCSDTAYVPQLAEWLQGVDLLFHETTFAAADRSKAYETGHSTSLEAAEIALAANAGQLITGHYSARYDDARPLVRESQTIFPNTLEGIEGKTYKVPFVGRR